MVIQLQWRLFLSNPMVDINPRSWLLRVFQVGHRESYFDAVFEVARLNLDVGVAVALNVSGPRVLSLL